MRSNFSLHTSCIRCYNEYFLCNMTDLLILVQNCITVIRIGSRESGAAISWMSLLSVALAASFPIVLGSPTWQTKASSFLFKHLLQILHQDFTSSSFKCILFALHQLPKEGLICIHCVGFLQILTRIRGIFYNIVKTCVEIICFHHNVRLACMKLTLVEVRNN